LIPADDPDDQPPVRSIAHVVVWPVVMLFILAYVEAVCYLGLFQTLTGYISAATILLTTEFFRDDGNFMTKALVLVAFVPSTFVWVALKEHGTSWRYFAPMLFLIEAGLLAVYMILAINMSPLARVDAPETMLIVAISVFAMSLHNVHSLQVMPEKAHIAITGLFGNFASNTAHLCALLRTGKPTATAAADFRKLLYPLMGFFGGAFFGALVYTSFGFYALAFPIALLIVMAAFSLAEQKEVASEN
jgi:uncharacterized membrane protein YoaK (UPF0700 family)